MRAVGRDTPPLLQRGFLANAIHEVAVSIGPKDKAWLVGDKRFRADFPPEEKAHRLTVVFAEPDLLENPLYGTVTLNAIGASNATVFRFRVNQAGSDIEARITVLYRGRILQTALLRGQVFAATELVRLERSEPSPESPGIEVLVEAVLRPGLVGLDERTRFNAALVLNHDRAGRAGGTVFGKNRFEPFRLDWVGDAVREISLTLERAEKDKAFGRRLDSNESVSYLRNLAFQGVTLYQNVGMRVESAFGGKRLRRIQVVSANPNTMLPVEMIYDLPPPVSEPKLCQNWTKALATGRCEPGQFHTKNSEGLLDVVCPSGFWGVSKIIERWAVDPSRLVADPKTRGIDFAVLSVPHRERSTLGPLTPMLFAASEHVNDAEPTELVRVRKALEKLTNEQVDGVDTWHDWAGQVKVKGPHLLLLLSHTELNAPGGAALEIAKKGGPERRVVGQITTAYVNVNRDRPGPIVMLLGCTTAVPLSNFQSFVVQFSNMGASLVVGTIAPVLGRHAGRAAEAIVEQLQAVSAAPRRSRRSMTFGEALLDIRRRLLANGILMAMCLAAYGDADWRLP